MVKYGEELESKLLDFFRAKTFVTTDMLQGFSLCPSVIISHLMKKGLISRQSDPLCSHRYLYFISGIDIEAALKERELEASSEKCRKVVLAIERLESAKAHHIELLKRHDVRLSELKKELSDISQ